MKLATFNTNGINQRLDALLQWLAMSRPDVVCLQELKADDNRFPAKAIKDAGYSAIWHGQPSWNGVAILSKGAAPIETRRGLPGISADAQSRYLEAAVNGIIVGCLYLPNGNPQPGPKFAYKLEWFERLNQHAASLIKSKHPVALCGDFNVVPTDFDIYDTKSWKKDACCSRKAVRRSRNCCRKAGPTRCAICFPMRGSIPSGTTFEITGRKTPAFGSITCC